MVAAVRHDAPRRRLGTLLSCQDGRQPGGMGRACSLSALSLSWEDRRDHVVIPQAVADARARPEGRVDVRLTPALASRAVAISVTSMNSVTRNIANLAEAQRILICKMARLRNAERQDGAGLGCPVGGWHSSDMLS